MVELELDDFKPADFQKEFQSACEVRKLGTRLGGVRLHAWVYTSFHPKGIFIWLLNFLYFHSSITTPHDAHRRCRFYLKSNTSSLVVKASLGKQSSLLLSTRSEVESFRHQGFVLPEIESLRVQSFMAS